MQLAPGVAFSRIEDFEDSMNTFIVFFRGINVGGHRGLLMKDLRAVLGRLGLQNVKTYLQSGNAVFQSSTCDRRKLSHEIGLAIHESHHFIPEVFVLSVEDLRAAIASNPFPEGASDPKSLHLSWLRSRAVEPDLEKLESLRSGSEKYELVDRVFYLHAPDGIGRSKLAANVEKVLGVGMTGRNWRTVNAVLSIALEMAE